MKFLVRLLHLQFNFKSRDKFFLTFLDAMDRDYDVKTQPY